VDESPYGGFEAVMRDGPLRRAHEQLDESEQSDLRRLARDLRSGTVLEHQLPALVNAVILPLAQEIN
jgi:hypothetical protein